jgi:hypothetical protein
VNAVFVRVGVCGRVGVRLVCGRKKCFGGCIVVDRLFCILGRDGVALAFCNERNNISLPIPCISDCLRNGVSLCGRVPSAFLMKLNKAILGNQLHITTSIHSFREL